MTKIVVKTLVGLLPIVALVTKLIKEGHPGEFLLADVILDSMQTQRNL
jgi:hypothetical protein